MPAPRTAPRASTTAARVCPLARRRRTSSESDSAAETTNTQPSVPSSASRPRWRGRGSILGGTSEVGRVGAGGGARAGGANEEAPAVHGRDRAVAARVPAAAARLDVADELEPPVALEVRVLLERRQRRAARHRELELLETDAPRGGRGRALE